MENKGEEEVDNEGGVGGQEKELFAHTMNLIIMKLRGSNRRVIDHFINSRSVYSFDFGTMGAHGASRQRQVGKMVNKLVMATRATSKM